MLYHIAIVLIGIITTYLALIMIGSLILSHRVDIVELETLLANSLTQRHTISEQRARVEALQLPRIIRCEVIRDVPLSSKETI